MSLHWCRPTGVAALALTVASVAGLGAQEAGLSGHQYGRRLAEARIPAGLVISDQVFHTRQADLVRSAGTMAQGGRGDVNARVAGEVTRLGRIASLTVTNDQGVLLIRMQAEPLTITQRLATSVRARNADQLTAWEAVGDALLAFTGVDPSLPGGVAHVGALPTPSCPYSSPVQFPDNEVTVRELLHAVVRQVPGLVWVLTYDPNSPESNYAVGLVCPDGSYQLRRRILPTQ